MDGSAKILTAIFLCAVLVTLISGLVIMALSPVQASSSVQAPSPEPTAATAGPQIAGPYLVREWDGFIGVFEEAGDPSPLFVTGTPMGSLRAADQALIRNGIRVSDSQALMQLLEDFEP